MSSEIVIAARGLFKHYGEVRAVDGVDLHVREGEIYAFLGRNGAGKTTTIRMLLGLIHPTAGDITVFGTPILRGEQAVFSKVGYLVESATAYPNLTVQENLDIQRRLTGSPLDAVDRVINQLHLGEYRHRRAGKLSLGNVQRLALARSLLHNPKLLILDEPANALDPAGIVEIRGLLRRLADDEGVTVFLSSHILAEVAHLADRIGIVHNGKLLEELSADELHTKARKYVDIQVSDAKRAAGLLGKKLGISEIEQMDGKSLRVIDGFGHLADISRLLVTEGLELTRLTPVEEDLEAHFMRLTGGQAE